MKKDLKLLEKAGFKYIVKLKDEYLSGWGLAEDKEHYQLISCTSMEEVNDLEKYTKEEENGFSNFSVYILKTEKDALIHYIRNKKASFSIKYLWTLGLENITKEHKTAREKAAKSYLCYKEK